MKLAALPLVALFAFGCATKGQPPAGARNDCGPRMEPLTLPSGTEVRNAPMSSATMKNTLTADTKVCASIDAALYGFRRLRMPDGSTAYVNESNLH
jgi:hypothetical protein